MGAKIIEKNKTTHYFMHSLVRKSFFSEEIISS